MPTSSRPRRQVGVWHHSFSEMLLSRGPAVRKATRVQGDTLLHRRRRTHPLCKGTCTESVTPGTVPDDCGRGESEPGALVKVDAGLGPDGPLASLQLLPPVPGGSSLQTRPPRAGRQGATTHRDPGSQSSLPCCSHAFDFAQMITKWPWALPGGISVAEAKYRTNSHRSESPVHVGPGAVKVNCRVLPQGCPLALGLDRVFPQRCLRRPKVLAGLCSAG